MKNILKFILKLFVICLLFPVILSVLILQLLGTISDWAADIAEEMNFYLEDITVRYLQYWSRVVEKLFGEKKK